MALLKQEMKIKQSNKGGFFRFGTKTGTGNDNKVGIKPSSANSTIKPTDNRLVTANDNFKDIPIDRKRSNEHEVGIEADTKKKWQFRYNDPRLNTWDTFIIIVAIYNCLTLSFTIAVDPPFANHPAYITFDWLLILCYLLDIIVNFYTTYLDKEGEEIFSYKMIAKHYMLGGRFVIDVLSTIPFDYLGGPKLLSLFGLLKITRLARISVIISRLSVNEQAKAILKMIQLTFYLFMVFHVLGCLHFWIVKQREEWVPPCDWIITSPPYTDLYESDIWKQYWMGVYYVVLTLAGNEIGPKTSFEYWYFSFWLTAGSLINANIFGEMAVLVQVMNKKSVKFQEQVDTANTAMKNLDIEPKLQEEVRDYFLFTQITLDEQQELEKFLELLSPSLKLEITIHIFGELMKKNIFKDQKKVNQTIRFLVSKLVTVLAVPEDILFRQDDESSEMYFIAKGECSVNIRDYKKRDHSNYKILKQGDHFGEISLIYNCRRTATVISRNYSTLGKISKDLVTQIQSDNPGFVKKLNSYVLEYNDPNKKFLTTALNKIDYFQGINELGFTEIIYNFSKSNYKKDHILFKQNQNADNLSIVWEGIVEFYTDFEGAEFVIERLYSGSLYNFRTFFMEDLMYVNVRCATNVTVFEISKQKIESIMLKHEDFKRKMLSYQNQILKYDKTFPLDYLVCVPKEFQKEKCYSPDALRRDNIFKNAIMRRVLEIRIEKSKPKLSDLLKMFEGKDLSNPKEKEELRKKMIALYEEQDKEDMKYTKLMISFDRICNVFTYQLAAIEKIDKRITQLQKMAVSDQPSIKRKIIKK